MELCLVEAGLLGPHHLQGWSSTKSSPHTIRSVLGCAMEPRIENTKFGSITIDGTSFKHDVVIRLDGKVKKRKKKLSKAVYGTSHVVSLEEAKHVWEDGAERLIIGTGKFGSVMLSAEAADYFGHSQCRVELLPTKRAIRAWNEAKGAVIGLFHVTC